MPRLCGGADAVRAAVPGRGRGPHRAADRRQGPEPGGLRRAAADRGARRVVLGRGRDPAGRVLAGLPAPGVAGPPPFLVGGDAAALVRPLCRPPPPGAPAPPPPRVEL